MKILGIIAEYNPFHLGHLHHIKQAKALIQPDITIVVMSPSFVQRGEPAITDKWTRSKIAIQHGIDIVIELPLVYTLQSADYFAKGSLKLLSEMGVTDLVFGSEEGNIHHFYEIAYAIEENKEDYHHIVKEAMQQGTRYADACNFALSSLLKKEVRTPNDLLGLSYVKEIVSQHYAIQAHCIKRTNNYHDTALTSISSATALRSALKKQIDVKNQLPGYELYQHYHLFSLEELFPYIQYTLLLHPDLSSLHLVDEGIHHLLKTAILQSRNLDELINSLTSKRYTQSRIQRMLVHIAMQNTKEEVKEALDINYIRLLAFSKKGQTYIKQRKKETNYMIISNITKHHHPALNIELKGARLLSLIQKEEYKKEYASIPYHQEDL